MPNWLCWAYLLQHFTYGLPGLCIKVTLFLFLQNFRATNVSSHTVCIPLHGCMSRLPFFVMIPGEKQVEKIVLHQAWAPNPILGYQFCGSAHLAGKTSCTELWSPGRRHKENSGPHSSVQGLLGPQAEGAICSCSLHRGPSPRSICWVPGCGGVPSTRKPLTTQRALDPFLHLHWELHSNTHFFI